MRGGFDRSRENVRTSTVTDNFGDLVQKPMRCDGRLVGPNYIYPITGRIGVDDVVRAFVFLSLFGNLGGESGTPGVIPKGPPTFVDALEFTTTISGSANQRVDFAPIGRTLSVSHANLNVAASRRDKHQVIIGLALAVAAQAQLGSIREGLRGQRVAPVQPAPLWTPPDSFGHPSRTRGCKRGSSTPDAIIVLTHDHYHSVKGLTHG